MNRFSYHMIKTIIEAIKASMDAVIEYHPLNMMISHGVSKLEISHHTDHFSGKSGY